MSLNNNFGFEIDFLPVGDGSRSGDAIAMRWGSPEAFYVAVVDGGTKESGQRLVEHVRNVYRAQHINLAVNTHPDADHVSGLTVVIESFPVLQLAMHRPWTHPELLRPLFRNNEFTVAGLRGRIRDALDAAYRLERTAIQHQVPIVEPFQGWQFGPLLALSPTPKMYLDLIPHFASTPAPRNPSPVGALDDLSAGSAWSAWSASQGLGLGALETPGLGLASLASRSGVVETWGTETLAEDRDTSEQNESSVVLYARFGSISVLLTADAGRLALLTAVLYAIDNGIDLRTCTYYQVPHHGSRANVSPKVLDYLLGPRLAAPSPVPRWGIASVAAGATTHPRKSVYERLPSSWCERMRDERQSSDDRARFPGSRRFTDAADRVLVPRRGSFGVMPFDSYTIKARIAPALLVLLPLLALTFAWFPELSSLPGLSVAASCGLGLGLILEAQVRQEGQALQDRLFTEWGAAPTTVLLRHRDATINETDKARYHRRLAEVVPGWTIPTPESEAADPDGADIQYRTATAWLRERTRDTSRFPVVAGENASYGFHRNLCALQVPGWIASVLGFAGSSGLLLHGFTLGGLAALTASFACGLAFWMHASVNQVKVAGMAYAVALIRAIDAVDKPE